MEEDMTMSDAPADEPNESTEEMPSIPQAASDEPGTLTIYAAATSRSARSGCGVAYVRENKHVGKAWSLGKCTRRKAAAQAILEAYKLSTREGVLGDAKRLIFVTSFKEAEEAFDDARAGKEPNRAIGLHMKECVAIEKRLSDAGVTVDIKIVEVLSEDPGLKLALAFSYHGYEKTVAGAEAGEEYDAADLVEQSRAAVEPMTGRRLGMAQMLQKRAEAVVSKERDRNRKSRRQRRNVHNAHAQEVKTDVIELAEAAAEHGPTHGEREAKSRARHGISRELRRRFKKQRRAEHEARREEKFQHLAENGPSQPTRRSARLQEQAEQNVLQKAFGQLEVRD